MLVLRVVGDADPEMIATHKRLSRYDQYDYAALVEFMTPARVVLLPNVLSEVSNLAVAGLWGDRRDRVLQMLAALIRKHEEQFVPSRSAVAHPDYSRLGLTDAAALVAQSREAVILSDDIQLCVAALNAGRRALSFDFVRSAR